MENPGKAIGSQGAVGWASRGEGPLTQPLPGLRSAEYATSRSCAIEELGSELPGSQGKKGNLHSDDKENTWSFAERTKVREVCL